MTNATPTGRVFGNRYVIEDRIARGGMADVFLARDRLLDRPVALKVLFPELSIDPNFVERFRREAQNAARLNHPNIVSVYDWGEEDKTYYIVMEYVSGKSLSTIIRENGALGANRAALIGADVASALSFAHRNGVVHRDVKPGNVLIDSRGLVKVTDFGIARARNATESLTQTGAVMGTATYFSPEQAQGMPVDERSDVYSLGIVLYETVSGKAPFTGDNPVAIAYKHVRENAVSLKQINPAIPDDYESITMQALAKSPANRYQTAEDLRADLIRFTRGETITATHYGIPAATEAIPRPVQPTRDLYREPEKRRNVAGIALAFLSLAAVAAIVAIVLLTNNPLTDKSEGEAVTVPDLGGLSVTAAQTRLSGLGLNYEVTRENNAASVDTVLGQDPAGNAKANKGDTVQLKVSSGPAPITLSDYTGQPQDTAASALRTLGFTVSVLQANSDQIDAGNVISQDPAAGKTANRGDRVTLTVSSGAKQVEVPDVTNSTQATAEQLLLDAGLRTRTVTVTSDQREGTVVSTDPSAGQQVDVNTVVTITVSNGPTTTTSDGNGNGNGNGNGGNGNNTSSTTSTTQRSN